MRKVMGIDLGARGIAWNISDMNGKMIDWNVTDLLEDKNYNKTTAVTITNMTREWFHTELVPNIEKWAPDYIGIEKPYKGKMAIPFGGLLALCLEYGDEHSIQIESIAPSTYKRKLGLCTGSYLTNKKRVIEWMEEKEPLKTKTKRYKDLSGKHKGDLADAYAIANYMSFYLTKRKRKKPETED